MAMKRILKFFRRGPGDQCRDEYEFGELLGSGSFANVYRATYKADGSEWAIKQIEKARLSDADRDALGVEVEILEKISHPNVVTLRQVFDTSKYFYMVMEMLRGQDLFDRVVEREKYTEREAATAVKQIAAGMDHCHALGVAHRDLKPENLMYSSPDDGAVVKIVDFGLGKVVGDTNVMFTACGTPGYVAPEILRGESYTTKVDIWSLGVILYILLCGFPPFYSENNAELFNQIKRASFTFPSPWWDEVSEEAKDLIRRMLVVDPRARYSAVDVMEHKWVRTLGAGGADTSLTGAQASIKKLRPRERFRAGVRAIGAMAALRKLGRASDASKTDLLLRGLSAASAAQKAAAAETEVSKAAPAAAKAGEDAAEDAEAAAALAVVFEDDATAAPEPPAAEAATVAAAASSAEGTATASASASSAAASD